MSRKAEAIFPIAFSAQTRALGRCAYCEGPLHEEGYGSARAKGNYCSRGHAEDAAHEPALRVPIQYRGDLPR